MCFVYKQIIITTQTITFNKKNYKQRATERMLHVLQHVVEEILLLLRKLLIKGHVPQVAMKSTYSSTASSSASSYASSSFNGSNDKQTRILRTMVSIVFSAFGSEFKIKKKFF